MSTDSAPKFEPFDTSYALCHAYVPEHIPSLMTTVSGAEPFRIEEYLGYTKDNWLIFVGYPLEGEFDPAHCSECILRALKRHKPEYLWVIGPEIPPSLAKTSRVRQSDQYLRLELDGYEIKASLQREVRVAAEALTVESAHEFTPEHEALVDELTRRIELPSMIAELYRSMPGCVANCETALVLNARDAQGQLTAFFVLERAAERFDTYVLGCHSKVNYAPHASDLLFAEMIALARERGVPEINLGLGVNRGIRRFKTKWGGQPYLDYEICECYYGPPKQLSVLNAMLEESL